MVISQVLIPKRAINFHKKRKVKEKNVFGNLVLQESKTCNLASRYRHINNGALVPPWMAVACVGPDSEEPIGWRGHQCGDDQ